MAHYRIITFDGGGIRGVYTAVLLGRLLKENPALLNSTTLFSGTSTGGIIALALAAGATPQTIIDWYRNKAAQVFEDSLFDNVRDLGNWVGAEYSGKKLKKSLTAFFATTKLQTLGELKQRVLIPAFDLDRADLNPRIWKPKFFHNFPGTDSDSKELIVDVAMRTSAAPTYFPSYQGYIDGGVMANNPCMSALAQALHPGTGKQQLENIRLISIGTGGNPRYIAGDTLDWGKGQWVEPLIDLLIDGVMHVAAYQCEQVLSESQFLRINAFLPSPVGMDEADKIEQLILYAESVDLTAANTWVRKNFI